MKKTFILFLLLIGYNNIQGQDFETRRRPMVEIVSRNYTENIPNGIDLSTTKGSPYEHDSFSLGTIIHKATSQKIKAFLRYNAYSDEIELKEDLKSTKINSVTKNENIYISLNDKEYHFKDFTTEKGKAESGYLTKKNDLYSRLQKDYIPVKKATTPFYSDTPAQFKDVKSYFLEVNGKTKEITLNKNKIAAIFPSTHKKTLTDFIKKEKLKFKKEDDIVKLITFYNTLKSDN
ncbi:hypothetical protein ACFSTE_07955 [Aquimarina hainanensis]|uniref:Uncharacterized protein n=1 Tax=Aquimarina hainanensis TaxID=1578017 RepID=A0ABW5N560_9FLAO